MRLTEEEMKNRKEEMIYNAFQLFCEKGIESVKLTEVAQKSKVSEATIYRYFGNKEQLVLEAFLKLWDTIMSRVYKKVGETTAYESMTGFEQIRVWLKAFRHLYQEDEEFIIFSYEAKLYFLRHHMKFDRETQELQMHSFYEPCVAALDKGKQDGSIPAEEDSEDLFYAIWGTIRGYVVKIVIYGKLYEYGNPWESRYEIMEAGILSALSSGWKSKEAEIAGGGKRML